jgi:hypothetical protein
LSFLASRKTYFRKAMNLPALLVLGHKIGCNNWNPISKQIVWTACTVAFFTSVRMGEIVPQFSYTYDKKCTLLWKHVIDINNDEMLLKIPYTKTKGLLGENIDLFSFNDYDCCPVKALRSLRSLLKQEGKFCTDSPVFTFGSGKFLTTSKINEVLKDLLSDIMDSESSKISCHSFRAAIPTSLANYPDKTYISDIKEWGRWNSDSYKLYTRLDRNKKKCLFRKISTVLIHDM